MKKIYFKSKPIVCLTAYNKHFAELVDKHCDLVLVGDSLGMAFYGDKNTRNVTLNEIIRHAKSVRKGIKKSILVVDMPYGTYNNINAAKKNAIRILKETKCDAVKLEGGYKISKIVSHLIKNNINVMGHIGLLPQKIKSTKGYKIFGKTKSEENKILKDLKALELAGVFAVVIEAVKENLANTIIKNSNVPIIGIGASNLCDGQILVLEDMLGLFRKVPKFVKKYCNLRKQINTAIKNFSKDTKNKKFPTKKNVYL